MTIINLIDLLKKSNSSFVNECLFVLKNENLIISENELLINDKLIDIYYHRQQYQKEQNKNLVLGYDELLSKLKKISSGTLIRLTSVQAEKSCYIIFYKDGNVISVLNSLDKDISNYAKLINEHAIYYNNDYQFYLKGKKVTKDFFFSTLDD